MMWFWLLLYDCVVLLYQFVDLLLHYLAIAALFAILPASAAALVIRSNLNKHDENIRSINHEYEQAVHCYLAARDEKMVKLAYQWQLREERRQRAYAAGPVSTWFYSPPRVKWFDAADFATVGATD